MMKRIAAISALFIFASLLSAIAPALAYSDYSFAAHAAINSDGFARVEEKSIIVFETPDERTDFEHNLNLGESTITEWKKFSKNVRFHFAGPITNQRITARKEFSLGTNFGSVIVEYDINAAVVNESHRGSRVTVYSLDPSVLAFDRTAGGATILGSNILLSIELPADAQVVKVAPTPDRQEKNVLSWGGPVARKWELVYERELPLSGEVSQFFLESYEEAISLLPLLLIAGFAMLLLFILVKFRKK